MGRSVELAATSGPMPEEWTSVRAGGKQAEATWREIRGGEVQQHVLVGESNESSKIFI